MNKPKVFGTKAGTLGVSSLSQVADKLVIKLKSLEESNPSIKDLNKIGKDQKINLPIRKKTFVERNILGKTTAPPSVTVKDKKETEGFRVGKTPLKDFTFTIDLPHLTSFGCKIDFLIIFLPLIKIFPLINCISSPGRPINLLI